MTDKKRVLLELEHEAYEGSGTEAPSLVDPKHLKETDAERQALKDAEKDFAPRMPCSGQLMFYDAAGRILAKAALRDISEQGVGSVTTGNPFKVGDLVMLEFTVEGNFKMSPLRARISRIEEALPAGNFKIGTQFHNPTGVQKQKIADFIAELSKQIPK